MSVIASSLMKRWPLPVMLLLWVLLLWGVQFTRRGYWEPDEARFVYVAREMAATGDWLVPHRHGVPYPDKPPLMFWLINLGETVFPAPFGSRLPLLIGVLLALGSVYGIGTLWRNRETGLRAVLVLSSAWQFWDTSGLGQIDGLLVGIELAALYLLFRNERDSEEKTPWAAFVLLGFAVLAKGPVGLLVPLGVYLAVRFSGGSGAGRADIGRLAPGLGVAVAIPLAWVAACGLADAPSEYLRNLLFTQNVSRAAGALGHGKPFYYFLFQAPLEFMPWTLFLPSAFLNVRRNNPVLLRRLAAWVGFVVLFFSLSASKRSVYILLALPGLSLCLADAWSALEKSQVCRRIAQGLCATGLVVSFGMAVIVGWKDRVPALAGIGDAAYYLRGIVAWPFLVLVGVIGAGLICMARYRTRWLAGYALTLCLVLAAMGALIYPSLNEMKVPNEIRPLAERFVPAGGRLLLYDIYGESLALHADRMGLRCNSDDELIAQMSRQGQGLAVFLAKHAKGLHARFPGLVDVGTFRMGSKHYVWAAFRVPSRPFPGN